MIRDIKDSPLYKIVNPKSVAFFGASNRFTSMGSNQLNSLISLGFEGKIYPVHPKETEVQGLEAYQSVLDLPEIPDVAVMVLPTGVVPGVLEECGQKGIKGAVIVSGGFKEIDRDGARLEEKIVETANSFGMRFLGPNCIGVANPHHKYNTTFLPFVGRPGFIGMASQSGSFITQMFDYLAEFDLSFSSGISVGNEANIDIVEAMEYLAACPHTRVIALYIESIRRGRAFVRAARKIIPHKPIVALYVGGSEAGKRASFSHTGALAGPDKLYDGVFHQSGVIRADTITELFDFCWVLGTSRPPGGNRVVVQTHSGGPGATAADACSRAGLDLPTFSELTLKKLEAYVPHTGSANNPVDLTFTKNPLEYFDNIPRILLEEPAADMLMVYFMAPKENIKRAMTSMGVAEDQIPVLRDKLFNDQARAMAELRDKSAKPIVGFSFHSRTNPMLQKLQDYRIPALPSPERAARAMAALVEYAGIRQEIIES
ncbi:MAG: CoA-binding protein [Deltaproteobacteria bacterium]|jgi:acyl-CoA synthetase (NDP forming)|nr:CoA-binding protein [Deltaproteobacteria bacterium]